jgi:glyoxalase/bleomycin resistance protein/dioxygenase superfamily protein
MKSDDYMGRHYALLVESVEATVGHLGQTAGLAFRSPARLPFLISGQGQEHEQEVRVCYAVDRSVELVEAVGRGPFSAESGFGLHHYGGVVPDLDAAIVQQRSLGNGIEWELAFEGQLVAVFFKGCPRLPGRLEFVSGQAPPLLDMFAESG